VDNALLNEAAAGETRRPSLSVRSFGITDRGRKRPTNEDQFLIAVLTKAMQISQTSLPEPAARVSAEHGHLFLVADGMGGHEAGEQASALAISVVERFALNTFKWFFHPQDAETQRVTKEFEHAVQQADATIVQQAAEHPELHGMGTTLTMAYCLDTDMLVAHVGDSRAYLFRGGTIQQLTQDHTLVAELVRRGEVPPDRVSTHRLRHVITNVLGGNEAGVDVEVHKFDLRSGDQLVLCSDGLTEMLSNADIEQVLARERDPQAACESLVAQANERGGADNITVVIAHFSGAQTGAA
jgi:protein phosphatase